jgi:hypothetical protein
VPGRVKFWLKVLRRGAIPLSSAAGWLGTTVLILGIIGIVVPLVFNLPSLLIAVVLVGLLVLIVAEGSYRVWSDTDEERKRAIADLDAARDEIARQADANQRIAQAKFVHVSRSRRRKARNVSDTDDVCIDVQNASEHPIRDVVFSWCKGTAPWGDPVRVEYLDGGTKVTRSRRLPNDLPPGVNKELFSAVVYFRDANGVDWRASPNGDLVEGSPGGQESSSDAVRRNVL